MLATARRPTTRALRIEERARAVRISAAGHEVASTPWPGACPLTIEVGNGKVRVGDRAVRLHLPTLAHMPVVTGLFTTVDLRRGQPPDVHVRTRSVEATQTTRQVVAAVLAVALALASLALVSHRPRVGRIRELLRRGVRARDATDGVVVAVLIVWWIVAPTIFDDGWIWAQQHEMYDIGS